MRDHWERETCGTRYGLSEDRTRYFQEIEAARYDLEPYIPTFARFEEGRGQRVLEIGVGAGSDFSRWVRSGAIATGVDLTEAAIQTTREHLEALGLADTDHELGIADAENLRFGDDSFDLVYSWGVLHHSPDTPRALREVQRVLRPGGRFRGMIYHVPSWVGWMVWGMHSLLRGRPWRSVKRSLYEGLESPGTKAYTLAEARSLLEEAGFEDIRLSTRLGPGDLLLIRPSDRYQRTAHRLLFAIYPRWLVRLLGDRFGLYLLLEGRKPPGVSRSGDRPAGGDAAADSLLRRNPDSLSSPVGREPFRIRACRIVGVVGPASRHPSTEAIDPRAARRMRCDPLQG